LLLATVLALAQAAAPLDGADQQLVRRWLVMKYADAVSLLDDMQRGAHAALKHASEPQTGMALAVRELGGKPPWRAIVVSNVLPKSAANDAGIVVGDRIAMIGHEWLDHEDARAFGLYQSDYPSHLPLVIQRGDRLIRVRLTRRQEPCIVAGYELAQHDLYLKRIDALRSKLDEYRGTLPELTTPQALELAHANLRLTLDVITSLLERQSLTLGTALTLTCTDGPRF
jgi:hypothetical protein